ncbi:hypothetical protein D3C87_1775000 [compost metagenome]
MKNVRIIGHTCFLAHAQDFEAFFRCDNGRADRINIAQLAHDIIIACHHEGDRVLDLRVENLGTLVLQFSEALFGCHHPFAIIEEHTYRKVCLGIVTGGGIAIDLDTGV